MSDTGRHFTHRRQSSDLRDSLLSEGSVFRIAAGIGHILARGEKSDEFAIGIAHGEASPGDEPPTPVGSEYLVFKVPFLEHGARGKSRELCEHEFSLIFWDGNVDPIAPQKIHLATTEDIAAFSVDELYTTFGGEGEQKDLRDLEVEIRAIALAADRSHCFTAQGDVV
jgi:hypothetical protein